MSHPTPKMSRCSTRGYTSTSTSAAAKTRRRSSWSRRRAKGGRSATSGTPQSTASGTRSVSSFEIRNHNSQCMSIYLWTLLQYRQSTCNNSRIVGLMLNASRGALSRHFGVAFPKNLKSGFYNPVTQNFTLIMNMNLVLSFGASGRVRKQWKFEILYFSCQWLNFPGAASG